MGGNPAADVDERVDEVDVEAVASLQRAGHVHVVGRVGVRGVRVHAEDNASHEQGEGI